VVGVSSQIAEIATRTLHGHADMLPSPRLISTYSNYCTVMLILQQYFPSSPWRHQLESPRMPTSETSELPFSMHRHPIG
jgi:hypothetical protein